MIPAPILENDADRLRVLLALKFLDTEIEINKEVG